MTIDSGGESYSKAFTLLVNNLNETPTGLVLSKASFNENIAASSTVATLSTPDINSADSHTYSFTSGSGDNDNHSFTIVGSSLKIKDSPNYETKSSYNIRLTTTDNNSGETYTKAFTLSVNDLNETPTGLVLSKLNFNENIAASSTVATLSTTDEDSGDKHSYVLAHGEGDTDNNYFYIDQSLLKIKTSPDFETKSSYTIRILTIDNTAKIFSKSFTLSVNNISEVVNAISGTNGNDSLISTSSNDSIDGAGGTDTVTYTSDFSNYSFTRGTDTLQIADQRTTGTTDGTDTLKNIEYIQFADQIVEESKVDVIKTYSGEFSDYKFYNKGNGVYQIKTDSGSDDITGIPTIKFSDKTISAIVDVKGTFDQVTGLETDSGKMFRLYNASFKRLPDADGLKYWIDQFSSGRNTIRVVASSFLGSAEFKQRYGENVSDPTFVNTLYKNVLGREADASGLSYWLGQLSSGAETRYEALLGFAESAENKTLFSEMTGFG